MIRGMFCLPTNCRRIVLEIRELHDIVMSNNRIYLYVFCYNNMDV